MNETIAQNTVDPENNCLQHIILSKILLLQQITASRLACNTSMHLFNCALSCWALHSFFSRNLWCIRFHLGPCGKSDKKCLNLHWNKQYMTKYSTLIIHVWRYVQWYFIYNMRESDALLIWRLARPALLTGFSKQINTKKFCS